MPDASKQMTAAAKARAESLKRDFSHSFFGGTDLKVPSFPSATAKVSMFATKTKGESAGNFQNIESIVDLGKGIAGAILPFDVVRGFRFQ